MAEDVRNVAATVGCQSLAFQCFGQANYRVPEWYRVRAKIANLPNGASTAPDLDALNQLGKPFPVELVQLDQLRDDILLSTVTVEGQEKSQIRGVCRACAAYRAYTRGHHWFFHYLVMSPPSLSPFPPSGKPGEDLF